MSKYNTGYECIPGVLRLFCRRIHDNHTQNTPDCHKLHRDEYLSATPTTFGMDDVKYMAVLKKHNIGINARSLHFIIQ